MESYKTILVERQADIAILTLNRPDLLNAYDDDMHHDLIHALTDLGRDLSLRAVVLTGAGRAFSAGGDINSMLKNLEDPRKRVQAVLGAPASAKALLTALLTLPHPLIAAVNGDAVGLGATIALAADVVVMSEKARIGDPHVRIGVVAGDGGAILWPALIGPARAKEMLIRGLLIKGPEAKAMGLVNHVAAPEELLARAVELATEIAAQPPLAVRWTKLAVNKSILQQLELIFDASIALEMLTFLTDDHAEAVHAMAEKRKGVYRGE